MKEKLCLKGFLSCTENKNKKYDKAIHNQHFTERRVGGKTNN